MANFIEITTEDKIKQSINLDLIRVVKTKDHKDDFIIIFYFSPEEKLKIHFSLKEKRDEVYDKALIKNYKKEDNIHNIQRHVTCPEANNKEVKVYKQ